MAEIAAADIQNYTKGRLRADDPEVVRMLAVAISVARNEVGWHVSPVLTDAEIALDGPDSRVLWLPTRKLVKLTSVEENGVDITAGVRASVGDGTLPERRVVLRKASRGFWTGQYGSVVVVMDHGFTEAQADDWRQAIMSMVDQMSLMPVSAGTGTSEFGLSGKRVDDVDYRYNVYATMAEELLFSFSSIIEKYRLPKLEFM